LGVKRYVKSAQSRISEPRLLAALIAFLIAAITFGTVVLLASGRVGVAEAIVYIIVPWALLAAAFRPDWLVLGLIAAPASFTSGVSTMRVLVLVAVAVAALLVTGRRLNLGIRSGLIILVTVNVAGYIYQANVGTDALSVNQIVMLNLTYFTLIGLLAFNLAVLGELSGDQLGTALIAAVFTTSVLALAGYGGSWFPSGVAVVHHTYLGWMAAAAISVSLVRLLTAGIARRLGHLVVTMLLLALTVFSVVRAAWIAAFITCVLVALRLRRQAFIYLLLTAIALALLTPTARQLVSRSQSGDIVAQLQSGGITSGRWSLWTGLWRQAQPALPWGQGFGYIWSLSSEDLLGVPGQFGSGEGGTVPPHSDFLFLLVEFGIPGIVLLGLFWILLFRAQIRVAESSDLILSRSAWLLLGMLIMGLTVALVDNVFLVRPFAERFFPVAGFILGLDQVERARRTGGRLETRPTSAAGARRDF
jgi:hypothetical protein